MSYFRTILGDLPSEEMGICDAHEHIIIEKSFPTLQNPDFVLNDVEKISSELLELKALGCQTIVDTMPANCGRNILKSVEIANRTDINLIVPTGLHLEQYYPPFHWRYQYTADQLTNLFVQDIEIGIDKNDFNGPITELTEHKAGLIKLATDGKGISIHQEKIFEAVVNTHKKTGVPILTHTHKGKDAIEQVERFEKMGVNPKHIVLSHVDKNLDFGYHQSLMQMGVNVEYDSAFRWKTDEVNWTYSLLEKLLPLYPQQITLGMDAARNTYWKSYGGEPGLKFFRKELPEELAKRGLKEYHDELFIENPKRIFSFTDKTKD